MRDIQLKTHFTSLESSVERVKLVFSVVTLTQDPGEDSHALILSPRGPEG